MFRYDPANCIAVHLKCGGRLHLIWWAESNGITDGLIIIPHGAPDL